MICKSMLVALLGFSLIGCAVYGDSRYGNRYYERQYSPGTYVERTEVYGAPRVYVYEDRRYPRPGYYSPPPRGYYTPPPRYYHTPAYDQRYHDRHDRNRRDYRPAPRPGWEGQRHHYQQQQRPRYSQPHWQPRDTPRRIQGIPMR